MPFEDFEPQTCPMTAEDVLSVLVDLARVHGLPVRGMPTLDMSIPELGDLLDLEHSHNLQGVVESLFNATFSNAEWQRLLKYPNNNHIRHFCEVVAANSRRYVVRPVTVLGDTSLPAGAFLTLRRALSDAGADISDLRPTSQVAPYLSTAHAHKVIGALCCMAPGCVPPLQSTTTPAHAISMAALATWLISLICLPLGLHTLNVLTVLSALACSLLAWSMDKMWQPRFSLANTVTFRDLCLTLTGARPVVGPSFPVVIRNKTDED